MRRFVIGLAMAGVLVVGACGSDDEGGGDDAAADEGTETTEAGGGGQASSPAAQAFCEGFAAVAQQGAGSGSSDPTALVDALRALEPPAEIADDFALAVEAAEAQAQAMSSNSSSDAMAEFEENAERYTAANENVTAYVTENCDLTPPEGTETPSTEAPGAAADETATTAAGG